MRVWVPIFLLLLGGCTTTVTPPASLQNPQTVFLLDHGRHTSLVMPHQDGLVRYAYGDWRWYAKNETGLWEGGAALLWPTQGALGRRVLPGPATDDGVLRNVGVGTEHLYTVQVEASRITALRHELDAIFSANQASWTFNPAVNLEFVHHPENYSAFHNSNHTVANWLARLGCEVRGSRMWASWHVEPPALEAGEDTGHE